MQTKADIVSRWVMQIVRASLRSGVTVKRHCHWLCSLRGNRFVTMSFHEARIVRNVHFLMNGYSRGITYVIQCYPLNSVQLLVSDIWHKSVRLCVSAGSVWVKKATGRSQEWEACWCHAVSWYVDAVVMEYTFGVSAAPLCFKGRPAT